MAPPPPLFLSSPGDLPGPVLALLDGAERLVAGSGLNSGAGRLRGPMGSGLHVG